MTPLVLGEVLNGRYRIERELGEGGMGVVYLVTDTQVPGERFAVKVLKEQLLHQEALTALREEVRKTRRLSHPNIVDMHSVNADGQRLYVLMEYLEGKSLQMLLDEEFGRGMPFSHAWPIIEDVCAALANAHDHNVIHSDLKPANVFVTTSGRTKLLDFGIARVSRGPLLQDRGGPRVLTPAYASCEMLEGEEPDRRDDLYSLACVIYEMLSGERPCGELNALEAREAGLKIAPLETLSRRQNLALIRALSFGRAARTRSVERFLQELAGERQRSGRPPVWRTASILGVAVLGLLSFLAVRLWWHPDSVVQGGANSRGGQPPPTLAAASQSISAAAGPPSIGVLPFVNLSPDPNQEYFSDGLSEELIEHLTHGADLKVIARTSSFQFRGKNEDARAIARILSVTHLLEGSVRKDGHQLRITAQLVRGADGVQIWSQSYDRNLVDVFAVQDEIADKVSHALHVALRSGFRAEGTEPDIQAYNLVLEGNYFKARRTLADVRKATRLYQRAIDINPGYALAWARLASAYLREEMLQGPPTEDQNRRALDALSRAIQLDPNLAWAYYTRSGFEMYIAWNWAAAKADTERVRAIDPRFEELPSALANIALAFGDVNRALELERDDLARNPLDPNALDSLGNVLCAAERLNECLQVRLRLLEMHPEFGGANSAVALAYLQSGQADSALTAMQRESGELPRLIGLSLIYWAMGRRSESDAALQSLTRGYSSIDAYSIAMVHAYRGEIDDAFQWLDRAYWLHDYGIVGLKTEPLLLNLHADPRFSALLSRMRLLD
jgi:eukaryotic-like serine/threonine-protein kinase